MQLGMPVPYKRDFRNGRTNRGFQDYRGRPAEAARVREAAGSPMLRELLIAAAQPSARLFTLGCDLGGHHEHDKKRFREVAGGYLQFVVREYAEATAEEYLLEADRFEQCLKQARAGHRWKVHFELRFNCLFRLGRDPETEAPAMAIYYWAAGTDSGSAVMSREALIQALKANFLPQGGGDR